MAGRWWPVRPAGGWAPSPATATRAARWRGGPGPGPATRSRSPASAGWRRRGDAAAALAWVTPASRARFLALAAHVRGLADPELHDLLRALPRAVFDQLLDAAYAAEGTAA